MGLKGDSPNTVSGDWEAGEPPVREREGHASLLEGGVPAGVMPAEEPS